MSSFVMPSPLLRRLTNYNDLISVFVTLVLNKTSILVSSSTCIFYSIISKAFFQHKNNIVSISLYLRDAES